MNQDCFSHIIRDLSSARQGPHQRNSAAEVRREKSSRLPSLHVTTGAGSFIYLADSEMSSAYFLVRVCLLNL